MVPTLLASPRITTDSEDLLRAAHQSGQPALRLQSYRPSDDLAGKRIAVYGEPLFAIVMATNLNHVLIEAPYDWLATLPRQWTRRAIRHTNIGEARALREPAFVKNADGLKGFEAQVYASGEELPGLDYYPDDYAVLVTEPVDWEVEYRCFVAERKVETASIYLRHGELAKSPDGTWPDEPQQTAAALDFCKQFLQSGTPVPPACVIDVGRITGRGWAVIEANPAYGAGIYGCDPLAVLSVVNRACIPAEAVDSEIEGWIMQYDVDME